MTRTADRHGLAASARWIAPLVVAAVAWVACDDSSGPDADPDPVDTLTVSLELVTGGLSSPLGLTAPLGDMNRLFVVQQGGRIRIIEDGVLLPAAFLDIDSLTNGGGEQGLLGLAFHPDYASNGHFYVNYTDTQADTQIRRYTVSATNPDSANLASAFPVLTVDQPDGPSYTNHKGGMIAFGPDDMLYIAMGDGGSGGDPLNHGQNRMTLLGDLLRLDVDGGSPYAIPADNPYFGSTSMRPEIWAYGLRNPWRFSFDRSTGDLYIADVGQGRQEEIDFEPGSSNGGVNYGWRIMEGSLCYPSGDSCSRAGLTLPIHEYDHSGANCSVTGGYVYRGSEFPDLVGRYFFADFCDTWLRSFVVVGGAVTDLQIHDAVSLSSTSSFGEDGAGELYVVSLSGGTVHRIVSP